MTAPAYSFRAAAETDLVLIGRWLGERHVEKWWGKRDSALASIATLINDNVIEAMIVLHDAAPIGYLQIYPAETQPELPVQPAGTLGVNFLIGDPAALGKAHGAAFINRFADACLAKGTPRLVADPDGRNISAVGCLGRAGFSPVELIGPRSARRLLMARDLITTAPQRSRRTR